MIRAAARALALAGMLAGVAACHRSAPAGDSSPARETPPLGAPGESAPEGPDAPALRRARCATGPAVSLGGAATGAHAPAADVEVGDAVDFAAGYAIGIVHRTGDGRMAALALVDEGGSQATVVDLGVTPGDAPPARAVPWGSGVLAAAYAIPEAAHEASRELAVYVITPGRPPEARAPVAQSLDDSFGFDLAVSRSEALLVWDEATPAGRGVVRGVSVMPASAAPSHAISPPESDAEAPRLLPTASGFVALWLARGPDATDATDHGAERRAAEAPGEDRGFGWVEAIDLDARGAPQGAVRRLTSQEGHVSAFDAEVLADGALLVIARDDGEAVDGSGGVLLRVRSTADRIGAPLALAGDGLGRGGPGFVGGPSGGAGWLGWIGPDERPRLMPLDAAGAPAGPTSAEDAWLDGRPLLALGGPAGAAFSSTGSARLLVAAPSDPASPLRLASCAR